MLEAKQLHHPAGNAPYAVHLRAEFFAFGDENFFVTLAPSSKDISLYFGACDLISDCFEDGPTTEDQTGLERF